MRRFAWVGTLLVASTVQAQVGDPYTPIPKGFDFPADQAKLFALLKPEQGIGVTLTSAYQLVPEASTSAIVVHHPAATYYLVKV